MEEHINKLKEYYDVRYTEGIVDYETHLLNIQKAKEDKIVRIFPVEKKNQREKLKWELSLYKKNVDYYVTN